MTGDQLTWMSGNLGQVNFLKGHATVSETQTQSGYTATVTSITPTTITSTLMVTAEIPEDGITVSCVHVGSVTIQTAGMSLLEKILNCCTNLVPIP